MPRLLALTALISLLSLAATPAQGDKKKEKKEKASTVYTPVPDPCPQMRLDKPLKNSPIAHTTQRGPVNTVIQGIDVSHYQGTIDWAAVAASGQVGYAFIKASESVSFVDDYYKYNLAQARKHGINVGSYHFFRAHVDQEAQLKHMISVIDPAKQDIVPVIDIENSNGVSVEVLASRLRHFLARVEEYYGRPPIIYTYVNFYNKYLAHRGFEHYPLFIAFYQDHAPRLSDGREYIMWQYTSKGTISGIKGNVDRSMFVNNHDIFEILYP
ncbi:MAG: glycoside hydrolase family 25 protein [Bacteroidaceae bacterium]|nr:glycoside hydrolase family 25 protein [Bacteroidaceae bacterium]MBO4593883.1 glycoside hydrolase family 25 protein [Bacteroidaceae bacterium]MBR4782327.1 glycoside hydrolase family 25 protein [Bacteroidaceae bacterium]